MARDFERGSGQYLNIGTALALQITGTISAAMWLKPESQVLSLAVGAYNPSTPNTGWGFGYHIVGGSGKQNYWSNGTASWKASSTALSVGSWQHCGFSASASSQGVFYLNGASDGGFAWTAPGAYGGAKAIGATAGGGGNNYDGMIAQLAVWDGVELTADQFAALAAGFDPRLVCGDGLVFLMPLYGRRDPEPDIVSGITGAVVNGPIAVGRHARTILPGSRPVRFIPASGATPDRTTGVEFDGSLDEYSLSGSLGLSDTSNLLISFIFKTSTSGTILSLIASGTVKLRVLVTGGRVQIEALDSGAANAIAANSATGYSDGAWHRCVIARNGTGAVLWLDGVDATNLDIGNGNACDISGVTDIIVGDFGGGVDPYTGCLGELYVHLAAYEDPATGYGDHFDAAGNAADKGADGSTPTGTQPHMYLSGGIAQFEVNFGSLGTFTEVSTPADCTLPIGYALSGAATLALSSAAALAIDRTLAGAITDTLTPAAALDRDQVHVLAGAVPATLVAAATLDVDRVHVLSGDALAALTPGAGLAVERVITGTATLSLAAAAALDRDQVHTLVGASSALLTPAAAFVAPAAAVIVGDVALVVVPAAAFATALTRALAGDLTVLVTTSAGLTFTPAALGTTFLDYVGRDLDTFLVLGTDPSFAADLEQLMSTTDGFAETVTLADLSTINGHFTDHASESGDLAGPELLLKAADVAANSIAHGVLLTVRARTFVVAGLEHDGLGLARVVLQESL